MLNAEIRTFKLGNKKLRIKDCKGLHSIFGLMFSKMEKIDGALIYANKIWMPFVKNELDLIFLDKEFNVLKQMHAVPMTSDIFTWKVYSCLKAKYCLELRAGLVSNTVGKKVKLIQ